MAKYWLRNKFKEEKSYLVKEGVKEESKKVND